MALPADTAAASASGVRAPRLGPGDVLFDAESGADSGEAEESLGVGGNVCEEELVTICLRALLGADQQVDAGAVDEVECSEVEHDASSQGALGVTKLALQGGGRCEVDLAADGQRHAIGLVSADDLELVRIPRRVEFRCGQRAGSDERRGRRYWPLEALTERAHRDGSATTVWAKDPRAQDIRRSIHESGVAYALARFKYRETKAVISAKLRAMPPFGFLTNHGLALLCIARDPRIRMRDIAADVQITERAAQRIVADLIGAGYLDRERVGRRNRYTIRTSLPISLPARRDVDLNALLNVLLPDSSSAGRRDAMPAAAAR